MNKKSFIALVLVFCFTNLFGQRRQNIIINVLGSTPLLGIKYDARLLKNTHDGIGASLGVGSIQMIDNVGDHRASLALGLNYLMGKGKHQMIVGANAVFILSRDYPIESSANNSIRTMFIPEIGYRFSPLVRGFTGQITWNPLRSNLDREKAYQYFGVGVGYSFK